MEMHILFLSCALVLFLRRHSISSRNNLSSASSSAVLATKNWHSAVWFAGSHQFRLLYLSDTECFRFRAIVEFRNPMTVCFRILPLWSYRIYLLVLIMKMHQFTSLTHSKLGKQWRIPLPLYSVLSVWRFILMNPFRHRAACFNARHQCEYHSRLSTVFKLGKRRSFKLIIYYKMICANSYEKSQIVHCFASTDTYFNVLNS